LPNFVSLFVFIILNKKLLQMHISITGDLGSGKSTVAKELCKVLNFKYLSTGLIQRQLGQEKGMDTLAFNKYANENKEVDDYIDQKLKDINHQTAPHVLDSRLGWHFVNSSFKIYVMAIEEVAALRVLADDKRIGEPQAADLQAKMEEQKERRRMENLRFEKTYGIKPSIFKDFDIVIDTSTASIAEVSQLILSLYKKHTNGEPYHKIWLSPQRIFPTQHIATLSEKEISQLNAYLQQENYEKLFPVVCLLFNKDFYVYDGHKRLSACIQDKQNFVPITLLAKSEDLIAGTGISVEQFLRANYQAEKVQAWELKNNIKFFRYPVW
jgi:CMP/dCMP kinase